MSSDVRKQPSGGASSSPGLPWYVLICGVMLAVPTVLILGALVIVTYFDAAPILSLTDPFFWVLLLPGFALLFAEYQAIIRRSDTSALIIAIICFWALACGSFSVISGFLGLAGITRLDSEFPNWLEYLVFLLFLMYLATIGYGHLKWRRQLRSVRNV